MGPIEIARIQNIALKNIALEADESQNGYIDDSELIIFQEKAKLLLENKQCTEKEFAALFDTNLINFHSNVNDFGASIDTSLEVKILEEKIAANEAKLERYEEVLSKTRISRDDFYNDFNRLSVDSRIELGLMLGIGTYITTLVGIVSEISSRYAGTSSKCSGAFPAVALVEAISGIALLLSGIRKNFGVKKEERIRNKYHESYLKLHQENEQLKAQLKGLQNNIYKVA